MKHQIKIAILIELLKRLPEDVEASIDACGNVIIENAEGHYVGYVDFNAPRVRMLDGKEIRL